MTKLMGSFLAGLLGLTIGCTYAAPVLLGTSEFSGGMGHSGANTPHSLVDRQMFMILPAGLENTITPQYPACIGCSTFVPVGWTGTKQFDESTDGQPFLSFLSHLTNSTDETLFVGALYGDSSQILGGGFGSASESQIFGALPVLSGWHVDHVVLTVLANDVLVSTETGFTAFAHSTWEFWGTADTAPSSPTIPEPGTFALLALGLAGLGYSRRKQ